MRRLIDAPNSDLFDVLAYIRFTAPPKPRAERAEKVRRQFDGTNAEMRAFLAGTVSAYEALGERELASEKLKDNLTARQVTLPDAWRALGGLAPVKTAHLDLQAGLYRD